MKARLKTHQMPGDTSKQTKQAMLEGHHPDTKRAKAFKNAFVARERAVLKERTQKEVEAEMKPCGHPEHPEDGNIGRVKLGDKPRSERAGDVEAHRADPTWFVDKCVKLGVPTPLGDNEYMWFKVEKIEAGELHGTLRNHPIKCRDIQWGDQVAFTADEIIDVYEES